ncbi:MAG: tryptophan synthase subunit alpha [Rhodothermales bacterium]
MESVVKKNRIKAHLEALKQRDEKAMGIFVTNGFPTREATLPILEAIDDAGADFIELGMPFSDPLAEGLPIQQSSEVALKNGTTMKDAFSVVKAFRKNRDTPLLLMGYLNPVFRYGVSNFCRDAHSSGVDGLILPDLPPEESEIIQEAAEAHNLDLVFLIAPNTPDERITKTDELASAFVYAVSMTGLTGTAINGMDEVSGYLKRAKSLVQHNPLMVGFGIKSFEDATRLSQQTDGFIVGSAVIKLIEKLWQDASLSNQDRLEQLSAFVQQLKYGNKASHIPA